MPATRVIATIKLPEVRDGVDVAGDPGDTYHMVLIPLHKERAKKAEILISALRMFQSFTDNPKHVAHGGVLVSLRYETAEHNIPRLEPEAWAKRDAQLAAYAARCRP